MKVKIPILGSDTAPSIPYMLSVEDKNDPDGYLYGHITTRRNIDRLNFPITPKRFVVARQDLVRLLIALLFGEAKHDKDSDSLVLHLVLGGQ